MQTFLKESVFTQAGFSPGYSTTDNSYILKCLNDFMQARNFKQAFDFENRFMKKHY